MAQSAGAAITKYHRLEGLNNSSLLSHSSGGWKSKIKVLAALVSSEASLLGLHMVFSLSSQGALVSLSLLIKTTVIGLGPDPYDLI